MTKIDAVSFSWAGDKYLGRPYSEMDCQKFVEKCMSDCGLHKDLAGSNAWYREVMRHGWVGSPEECRKLFGLIPKGALLFILKQDGKEPSKYQGDGIGNASHIGIYIERQDGAINSSSYHGKVCYSKFKGKSINGGWNRIGLYDRFDYGKTINWYLDHAGIGEPPAEKEGEPMQAVTYSENGGPINLRAKTSTKSDRLAKIQPGQKGEVLGTDGEWTKVRWGGLTGWIMSEFLVADDSQLPAEDPDDFTPVDAQDQQGTQKVTLTFTVEELAIMLPILESMSSQIIEKVGRG